MTKLLALLLFIASICQATTLTGTLSNPDGTGVNGYLYLSLSQQGALQSAGSCGGPIEVVPTYLAQIKVTNGALSGATTIYGNDCMLPTDLYYNVTAKDNNGNVLFTDHWIIAGTTLDIGTIVSAVVNGTITTLGTPGYVMTNPAITQSVTQPSGTTLNINNLTVQTILTLPDGSTCTNVGCSFSSGGSFVTLNTAQTITGQKTFNAAILGGALGTTTAPFGNIFSNGLMDIPTLAIYQGSLPTPSSSFTFYMPFTNVLGLEDDSSQLVMTWDATTSSVNHLLVTAEAYMATEWGFINRNITGANLTCPSSAYNGLQAIRTDLANPELQACLNGVAYVLGTGGASGSIALTNNILKGDNAGNAVAATGQDAAALVSCIDASGSTTAQSCSTTTVWSIVQTNWINYTPGMTNSGALTINVNSTGAAAVRKCLGTAALVAGDFPAGITVPIYYDGTFWETMATTSGCGGGSGTVTSVSASVPSFLTVNVTNPTTTPAVVITATSESQNLVLASPNGSSGAMSPRAIVNADLPTGIRARSIGASFGVKGGAPLTTTQVVYVSPPFACTISAWTLMIDTGTITVDIWKIANGTAVPTVTNTITASALPAISTGTAKTSSTLTGWTTSVAANDLFGFDINAVSSATTATIQLECDEN